MPDTLREEIKRALRRQLDEEFPRTYVGSDYRLGNTIAEGLTQAVWEVIEGRRV